MCIRVVFFVLCLTLVSSEPSKLKPSLDVKDSLNKEIVADATEDNVNNNDILEEEVGNDDIDVDADLMEDDTLADEEEDKNEDTTADLHDAKPWFWGRRRRWGKKDSKNAIIDEEVGNDDIDVDAKLMEDNTLADDEEDMNEDITADVHDAKPWGFRRRRRNAWFGRRRWLKKDSKYNMKDAKPRFGGRRRCGKKDSTYNMKDAKPTFGGRRRC